MKNIIAVLALACAMLASTTARAEVTLWEQWGIDPSASSVPEACEKAPKAIQGFQHMPQDVKDSFKKVLGNSCKAWTQESLTPGTRIQEMWSGIGSNEKIIGPKEVGYLPVSRAPDGREYKEDSVFQAPIVFRWKFTSEQDGKTYLLYLPWVCFNWSWGYGVSPMRTEEKCVTVEFDAELKDIVRFAIVGQDSLRPSSCFAVSYDGGKTFSALPAPCGNCDFINSMSVVRDEKIKVVQQSGFYEAKQKKQVLRLPVETIQKHYVFLCVTRAGVDSLSWYVPPSVWSRFKLFTSTAIAYTVPIPYGCNKKWPTFDRADLNPKPVVRDGIREECVEE